MGLHARDARALETLVVDLRRLHGDALQAVLLVGEAAGPEYRPRASPLAVVVVLAGIDAEALRRTRSGVTRWRRFRIQTPLLLEATHVERSLDVFPLELLELRDRHLVLYGRVEALGRIEVTLPHLRLEVEQQLRGKRMHLMASYLEARESTRRLRRLLLDSTPAFNVLLRGLIYLRGGESAPRPADPQDLIEAVERLFGFELPALRRIDRVRRGREVLLRAEVEPLFEAYLADVCRLERLADAA